MHGRPVTTCVKYQMYLYDSEAITYLNAILWVITEPALCITITHLEKKSSVVKLPYSLGGVRVKKPKQNLCGWGTITRKKIIQ
jgi:hypothetical protein